MGAMTLGKTQVTIWTGQFDNAINLPESWRRDLWVKNAQDTITLRAGNRQATARVVFNKGKTVRITDSLRQELCLPQGAISVKAEAGALQFGPFIGLYAVPSDKPGKPFGELTAVFVDMMKLAEEQGIALYVFTPGEVRWDQGYAVAHIYKDKSWVRTKRPLPDLVISKMMGKPAPWREQIELDMAQIARHVPYGLFSNATGDKWTVHNLLNGEGTTRRYLPETLLVQSPQDIEAMLARHLDVYVKPAYGTQGRSIFRLHMDNGAVAVKYTRGGVSHLKRLRRGGTKWLPFLQKTFCGKRQFLVQQTIDLVTAPGGRPVDFRWLVQKDGKNQYGVTARVARIGAARSITTNLHTGGEAVLAEDFLRQSGIGTARRKDLLQQIDEAALQITSVLETQAGRIGELGIDFGLTTDGSVYLIEINPRPGRQMLKDTSPPTRLLSLLRNLEYARYVSGYGLISD